MSTEIIVAIINAAAVLFSTILGSIAAASVGKRIINHEKIKADYISATNDIRFLMAVQDILSKQINPSKPTVPIRDARIRARNTGLIYSGLHTPGRAVSRIDNHLHR